MNRAIALMNLGKYGEALKDYEALDDGEAENWPVSCGVCHWLLGSETAAIEHWHRARTRTYTDPAGGMKVPALLFYAAVRTGLEPLRTESVSLLRQVWEPSLRYTWPGPIAGLLLGEVSEPEFLASRTFVNETLEMRRQVRAHFWVGVQSLDRQESGTALEHFRAAATRPLGFLETEYYLAEGEVRRLQRA